MVTTSLPAVSADATWVSVTDATSYATVTGTDGSKLTFALAGTDSGGLTSYTAQGPAVTAGLALTKKSGAFSVTDSRGVVTTLTSPAGGTAGTYLPSSVTQPGSGSNATGYVYDPTSTDVAFGKPVLVVAPDANAPAGTPSTTWCPNP